jgi:hypothetical protein
MPEKEDRKRAMLYMHLAILLWGITGVLGRGISLSEGMLVWYRMGITSISMAIFLVLTKPPMAVAKRDLWQMLGIGTLLTTHWLFFYGSIKYANISITLCMMSSSSLFNALLEPLITGRRIRRSEILFGLGAMIGIWIIFYTQQSFGLGIILGLTAALIGSTINIFNKDIIHRYEPAVVSFYELGLGFAILTLFLPVYVFYFHITQLIPTSIDWLQLMVLAILCTHITMVLWLKALKNLSPFTLNLTINLEPVYGIALAFLIFHENKDVTPAFFLGGGIIILVVISHGLYQAQLNRG